MDVMDPKEQTVKRNLEEIRRGLSDCIVEAKALYEGVSGSEAVQNHLKERCDGQSNCVPEPDSLLDLAALAVVQVGHVMDLLTHIRVGLGLVAPKVVNQG